MKSSCKAVLACIAIVGTLSACRGQDIRDSVVPSGNSAAANAGNSWMLPEAKNEPLVYSNDNDSNVYVYSLRKGNLVGTITGLIDPYGECSDSKGNVFITNSYHSNSTYEYAHAGTKIIKTFRTGGYPQSCAWDPATNDLAICYDGSGKGAVDVFEDERGQPATYVSPIGVVFCTYDDKENLFLDDGYNSNEELAELPRGSASFTVIPLNQGWVIGSLQWDGKYLALDVPTGRPNHEPSTVYQIAVSGSQASIVGKTVLYSRRGDRNYQVDCQMWIHRNTIFAGQWTEEALAAWHYPAGGKPTLGYKPKHPVCGITVSVVP